MEQTIETPPNVTLILGGVERALSFDFNTLVKAESHSESNLLQALASQPNASDLRALLWAAMLPKNPALTIEQAGALITPANVGTIYRAIVAAFFGTDNTAGAETPAVND